MKIALSACLYGKNVRYDGGNKKNQEILDLLEGHEILLFCPEFEAGLPLPHDPIELKDGKAVTSKGEDLSDLLQKTSFKVYERIKDCNFVILKQKSPTCGKGKIYDGTFTSTLIEGNGIFASLCLTKGMKAFTEEEIDQLKKELH